MKTDLETIASSAPRPQQTASARTAELERGRWLVIAASFILFLAGVAMGFRSAPQFGIPIILWGLAGFVVATAKALRQGATPEQNVQVVRSARKVLLVDGIGVCLAGLYVASRFPGLDAPFGIFLGVMCCLGVMACVLRLCGIEPLQALLAPRAGSPQPGVVQVQLASRRRGARIGLALVVLSGLVLLTLGFREWNRRTRELTTASVQLESPTEATAPPTPVGAPASPPVLTAPPSAPLQPLLTRVAALPPLTPAQIESYVEQNKRTAESLLAAYRMGANLNYLTEAATRFPTDPDVQYAVIAARAFPEQQRQWIDAYKASSPDNALAWYFSSLDHFKAGNGAQALQELAEATRKPAFRAELAPTLQAVEELQISAGRAADEARVTAFQACAQVPHLGPMRELAQAMQTAAEQYRQQGDAASAESLAGAGLLLGSHLSAGGGSQTLINQLVGISIEKRFLLLLDPTRDQDPFGRPIAGVRAAIERQQALLKDYAQSMAGLMFRLDDTELANYMERVKLHGEEAALAWLKAKHGQP